ncbi:winged helix DNA-binding domain-containing protein [soil metagenome]
MLHATDSASVFLQARARTCIASPSNIERELYDDLSALRMLAMRRTLFLVPVRDIAMIHAAASQAIAQAERRRTIAMFAEGGVGPDPSILLEELEAAGLAALRERGEATTSELTALDPRLGHKITLARGKAYEGTISVSQKVFFHLALDGKIGRGRPRGTWIASQFRWSPIERWLAGGIPDLPVDDSRAELVRRWLRAFGPGTRDDIKWWAGWTVAAVKQALAAVEAVEVELDGDKIGYLLADDLEPVDRPASWVALLPALDATTMGWAGRDWYLGPHRPALFDRNGNAGPTIWVDGRVVGGWAQRRSGEVVPWLLEDVGTETKLRIEQEAVRLQSWLGPTRVSGSFPTPLEIELRL